jgi:gamma-tubulin complex component 5
MAILEMPLSLNSLFDALTLEQVGDITQLSLIDLRERRTSRGSRPKRRLRESQRRLRRNVIGFTEDLAEESEEETDSDSENDQIDPGIQRLPVEDVSLAEESFMSRVEDMTQRLDKLIRHLQRSIERIADASTDTDSPISVWSFSLQDWDR